MELDFEALDPIEVPIKVKGVVKYVLKEASADTAAKYRNAMSNGATFDTATKKANIGQPGEAELIAVANSLYEVFGEGQTKMRQVLMSTVRSWKNSVVSSLFDKLKEISPGLVLTEQGADNAKNSQSEPPSDGNITSGSHTS